MTSPEESNEQHDLLIVGGGPAGLSAATYGSSERLNTGVVEVDKLGGQAGTSSLIENYLGFHQGVTGPELMGRAAAQAARFGTSFHENQAVNAIDRTDRGFEVTTDNGKVYVARNVLLANGVQYNRHPAKGLDVFLGRGVHYGSPALFPPFKNEEIFVVGGANSAGQAAFALADCEGCRVHMLVRGKSLEEKMSGYLIDKIGTRPNIIVHTETDLEAVDGRQKLEEVALIDRRTGRKLNMPADELFMMIGASPRTVWLPESVVRDEHGYVVTGPALTRDQRNEFEDTHQRPPFSQESSMEGVFAAGDVVSGSQKRVASAVGSGADAIGQVHGRNAFLEKSPHRRT